MQLQSINPTTFQSKTRFLDKNTTFRLYDIANKMRNATRTINKNGEASSVSYLVNIGLKDKQVTFIYPDFANLPEDTVELNIDKTSLIINKNGQILDYKKPFFMPWWNIMKNAKKYLTMLHENFYNNDIVEKQRLTIMEFSETKLKKLKKEPKEI